MGRATNLYGYCVVLGLQNSLEYRANFLINVASSIFPVLIQYYLWTAAYGIAETDRLFGYTYTEMITYVLFAGLVSKLIQAGFEYEIAEDIKEGGLNKYLVKPINYILMRMFMFIGQKMVYFAVTTILIFAVLYLVSTYWGVQTNLQLIVLFLLSLFISIVLNFILFMAISLISFWLAEISYFFEAPRIFAVILSGGLFPLEIFEDSIIRFVNYLPFKYTVNFSVNIITGKMSVPEILQGLITQIIWIVMIGFLVKRIWRAGMKKYNAIGG